MIANRNGPVGKTRQIVAISLSKSLGKLPKMMPTSTDSIAQYITESSLLECPDGRVFVVHGGFVHEIDQSEKMTDLVHEHAVLNVLNRWTAKQTVGLFDGVAEQRHG